MRGRYPILEFDPARQALIEPSRVLENIDPPEHCVICFFREVIEQVCAEHHAKTIARLHWENGEHVLREIRWHGKRLAIVHPGVGAAMSAALLEEIIALGSRKFIACGGAGVLQRDIAMGHLIVPTSAVRDEGTSYHYLAPAREVKPASRALAAIKRTLRAHQIDFIAAKTWTTDAPYRETRAQVKLRRAEGCVAVEMEAAAFFAVAKYRRVPFAQLLYGGDDVSGEGEWSSRGWTRHRSVREQLFWLSAEACLAIA